MKIFPRPASKCISAEILLTFVVQEVLFRVKHCQWVFIKSLFLGLSVGVWIELWVVKPSWNISTSLYLSSFPLQTQGPSAVLFALKLPTAPLPVANSYSGLHSPSNPQWTGEEGKELESIQRKNCELWARKYKQMQLRCRQTFFFPQTDFWIIKWI